ncbi:hypothetical protein F1880_007512 [Penicillium rolfsii]|nr:hypothetical protein F1880_007512 [Penicillium rolfsii]
MTEVDKPLSLLDAVRSQLVMDSDSDSSQSTAVKVTLTENKTPPMSTPLDQSVSTNPSLVLVENTNDREPFPDFDQEVSEQHRECDRAHEEAIAAAVQENIRSREIDPAIVTPLGQPVAKRATLNCIKDLLSEPHLRGTTRKRFIALTNMVIRLDHVLFRRSEKFLGAKDTADAAAIAKPMLDYWRWVDLMLTDLVAAAGNVFGIMGFLAEEDVPIIHKYRHMAIVAATHLRKPRILEQRLLTLYLDLYDEWIHSRFLHMSNRMIMREADLDPACLALINWLNEVWEILSRSVDNYAIYRERLSDIDGEYLLPTLNMIEIPQSPSVEEFLVPDLAQLTLCERI